MNLRSGRHSGTYQFFVTILLLVLLEASFKLLDGKIECTFVLKAFAVKGVLASE
jgi:hypothetical protein